jgi:hypothetical protein
MKHKRLLLIVLLTFILGVSFFFGAIHFIYAATEPQLTVVQDGTSDNQIATLPVDQSFTVDIYINNTSGISEGIDEASFALAFDPTVLQCTSTTDSSLTGVNYLPKQDNLGDLPIDNTNGLCVWGLTVVNTSNATNSADVGAAGILATATFQVISTGTSALTIEPSANGVAYLDYPSGTTRLPITDVTTVSGQYGTATVTPTPTPVASTSPTPTPTPIPTPTPTPAPGTYAPQAVINIANGTTYETGSEIILDGSSSTNGHDGSTVCNITIWDWLVQYLNGTVFGAYNGEYQSIVLNNPASLKITLIVTAPDTVSPPNPQYTNTSSTNIIINVELPQQLAQIDVITQNGGEGQNATSGPFGPQQLVQLYALVTYDGAPVANKEVTFTVIDPNGVIIAVNTALTNTTGYATSEYRTPWLSSGNPDFGTWTVLAYVEVSQVVVSDTVSFEYNYLVTTTTTNGITLPASVDRGSPMKITVAILTADNVPQNTTVTISIYDQNQVPIDFYMTNLTNATNNTISTMVTIPTWAFTGTATVYVDILTNNPTAGGTAYSPQQTATFQIS